MRIQAERNLERCRLAMSRMAEGSEKIGNNPDIAESFRLANRAMLMQYRWNLNITENLEWRPFQMGFILLAIKFSCGSQMHTDRNTMDLLWFLTGGGKTEAYLALCRIPCILSSATISLNRIPDLVLRLLCVTPEVCITQQFMRAASMILACDAIRRGCTATTGRKFGRTPISIGLWVGGEATPASITIRQNWHVTVCPINRRRNN